MTELKRIRQSGYKKTRREITQYLMYRVLEKVTGKKHRTIVQYFHRNKLHIDNINHFVAYINRFYIPKIVHESGETTNCSDNITYIPNNEIIIEQHDVKDIEQINAVLIAGNKIHKQIEEDLNLDL